MTPLPTLRNELELAARRRRPPARPGRIVLGLLYLLVSLAFGGAASYALTLLQAGNRHELELAAEALGSALLMFLTLGLGIYLLASRPAR